MDGAGARRGATAADDGGGGGRRAWTTDRAVSVALVATFVAWLAGTTLSLLMAMASTIVFLGDQPTAAQQASGDAWTHTAVMIGLLISALGGAGALMARRWKAVGVFAVAFALTPALLAVDGGIRDVLRMYRDGIAPPPRVEPGPPVCAELSGGDNECPGG